MDCKAAKSGPLQGGLMVCKAKAHKSYKMGPYKSERSAGSPLRDGPPGVLHSFLSEVGDTIFFFFLIMHLATLVEMY